MATFEQLHCCLTPDDVMVSAPEMRGDCGPCVWTSGIVESSDAMARLATGINPAAVVNFRKPIEFNDPLDTVACVNPETGTNEQGTAPSGDPCDCTTTCISSYRVVKQYTSQCWTQSEVASMCSPIRSSLEEYIMDHVSNEFWIRKVFENQIMGMLEGIMADNAANDGGDMIVDAINDPVATPDGSATTTGFNSNAHLCAIAQLGCTNSQLEGILMHRDLFYKRLMMQEGANCCVEVYDSERIERSPMLRSNRTSEYTYQGYPVYLCDHPMLKQGDVFKTYYFGKGLFQFGAGDLMEYDNVKPFHAEYEPCDGNGGFGSWKWYSRVAWALHPMGFQNNWEPNYTHMKMADLIDPTNWDRVMERTNIPLVCVVSN